jgi:hypothetical protein
MSPASRLCLADATARCRSAGQIGGEHCVTRAQASSVNAALQAAASRHVTVVAASGDIGVVAEPCDVYRALAGGGTFTRVKEVNLLASDPLVPSCGRVRAGARCVPANVACCQRKEGAGCGGRSGLRRTYQLAASSRGC